VPGLVRLLATLCALTLIPAAAAGADTPAPQPGQVVQRTYTNAAGTRAYDLYVPPGGTAGKPLMIWLHGCGGPDPLQAGHALTKVAQEKGFAVAFPIQPASANALQCWNWSSAAGQHRGAGEPSIIAGITTSLRDELGSDASRIYIGGYSAGGAMTTVMGAAYPDLYAAISPSAGAPYAIFDLSGQKAYQEMGSRARPVPAFILQGLTDELSNYLVGRANIAQWLGTDDYADDSTLNYSVPRLPSSLELKLVQTSLLLPVVIEHYRAGGCELAQFLTSPYEHLINGALFYYDQGLALQRLMMDFLLSHRLGGPHHGCG
jgi:poly(hydroxyalkanoate) depolymerase family esterase